MRKQRSVVTAAAAVVILSTFLLSVTASSAKDDSMESARERVRARLETRQAFPDRPKIITKHHFMRERKSSLVPIPKPFVVSTELNVRLSPDHSGGRRGRTWKQHDGSTVVEGETYQSFKLRVNPVNVRGLIPQFGSNCLINRYSLLDALQLPLTFDLENACLNQTAFARFFAE